MWITTSWDDGHSLDQRLAARLDRYDLRGTFYIARDYLPDRLTASQIAALAARHEIGAHSLTHPDLTALPPDRAYHEIAGSGAWVAAITGRPVTAFCPPCGLVNDTVRDLIAAAGYEVARTTQLYHLAASGDPLRLPTTTCAEPFPFLPAGSLRERLQPLRYVRRFVVPLRIPLAALRSWSALALALLDRAAATGGVWHLWGHSWEIERYGLWDDLDRVLAATRRYPHARRVTNTELVRARHRAHPTAGERPR